MSRHLTFLMILSTFVNLVYPGLLEGTTIDVPQVQPASYNFNGSMDQVQFYGCPDRYQTRVKKALASVSKTAASARDFLDNPSKDKADAIAMDAFFGRGFTAYPNATKNLKFVRNVFDSISQGVTIYPTNPITKSTTRIACLTSQNSHPSFAQHPFVLAAVEGQALVVVMPRFWSEVKKGSIKACAPVSLTDTRAFYFLHEFAHLAGVGVNPRLPEVYDQEDTLRLNADQAIQNAQNYATAAHGEYVAPFALSGASCGAWNSDADELERS